MKALLQAKCLRSFGGTVPLKTSGMWESGWNITAAQPFGISAEGFTDSGSCIS